MFQPGGEGEDGELFVPSPLPPRKSPDTAHWDVRPPVRRRFGQLQPSGRPRRPWWKFPVRRREAW